MDGRGSATFAGDEPAHLVGPGLLFAGVSIAAGEWLFGAAVTGQYGPTLLWLASLSIIGQVFFNLEVMRYALYCGEPIFVGYLRTWPGPRVWTFWYMLMDFGNFWPLWHQQPLFRWPQPS